MKYKASTIEPMLEYVLDFLIRKILRLIYRCLKAGRSERIDYRVFSNCFDSSSYGYDRQIGLEIASSKEELVIRARNYVITIIEFRRRLVGVYRKDTVKPIGSMASINKRNKIFALANDLFYACFLRELGVTDDDRKSLSDAISLVPYLILSICKLVTFKLLDLTSVRDKATDITASLEELKLCGAHRVYIFNAFNKELSPYADHLQLLLLNLKINP